MAVLLLLGVGALYLFLKQLDPGFFRTIREKNTASALAQAKDALIGYAATRDLTTTAGTLAGAQRPGDLPCPDTDNDGSSNSPCNGNAIGRLPWRTLGLPELSDGSGERLWYAVSTNFKNSTRTGTLNSDTTGTITVRDGNGSILFDGSGTTGAVAVIIAPGVPLLRLDALQQVRTAANQNNPQHYLDNIAAEDNADFINGNTNGFFTGPVRDATGQFVSNDQVLVLTRDELMAAVDKRVAMEVRTCVENNATANGNQYPWPAPHANPATFNGIPNTFFGRIPNTIAGINPEAKLYETLTQVSTATATLAAAATPEARTAAAQALGVAESALRQIIYQSELAALSMRDAASKLQASALAAKISGTSPDAGTAIADATSLETAIRNTGFDAMVPQVNSLNADVQAKLDAFDISPTAAAANSLAKTFFDWTAPTDYTKLYWFLIRLYSPNTSIGAWYVGAISAAYNANLNSYLAAIIYSGLATPTLADKEAVLIAARNAVTANKNLIATVQSQRVSIQAYDIAARATSLNGSSIAPLSPAPYADYSNWAAKLRSEADAVVTLIASINTNSAAVVTARSNAQTAATNASNAAAALIADPTNTTKRDTASTAGSAAASELYFLAGEVASWASYLSSIQITAYANSLSGYGSTLSSPADAQSLKAQADYVANLVNRLTTAATSVVPPSTVSVITARNNAFAALQTASSAAQTAFDSFTDTNRDAAKAAALAAAASISTLSTTIANNGDNLTYNTLKYWKEQLQIAAPGIATQTISGYLYEHATIIYNLANAFAINAAALDTQASTAISAAGTVVATPSDANVAAAIAAAGILASGTGTLLSSLSTSTGEAMPVGWSGATGCAPNSLTGTFSWWDNGWQQHVFYQIGNISSSAAGTLTVNGSGTYRVVTVAHGQALTGQARPSAVVADYIEAGNADPSRNNGAPSPTPSFVQTAPGPQFNDRLGYQ